MKILHILYSGLGGHGNVFFSLVDADKNKEFEYEAIFFGIENARQEYIEKAQSRGIPWHAVKKKPGVDLVSYKKIIGIIKRSNAAIIFLHAGAYIIPAKIATLFTGKKIIVRETEPNHLKTKFDWLGLKLSLIAAYKVVFLSVEYSDEIKKRFSSLVNFSRRTTVIPNGIDLSVYKPLKKDISENINIGMQSRLSPSKDHITLLKSFSILISKNNLYKPVRLFIAGDGVCKNQLQLLANELNIASYISFTGMLEESLLPAFINSLDIYVHATLGETMSTAIMQVMACRLPVIASNVNGVNNMVTNNENGLLVPAKDEVRLAEAIEYLLKNPAEASRLADAAYNTAINKFSNQMMFNKYKAIFNN